MVNPMEIMPVLVLAFAIACIPVLSDGPFERQAAGRRPNDRTARNRSPRQ